MSYTADQLISIISVVPKAIAVVDNNMKYVAASHRWVEDYGLQGKNLIGESHYDLFPEIGDAWKAIHSECLRGKAQTNPQDKFVRLDGTVQWLSWDVSPWLDPEGNILGMVMYSEDITAQIEEETQMKRVLDLYEETNEAARIGSWEHDLITGTIFWSPMVKHIYEVEEDFIPSLEKIRDFLKKDSDKAQMDSVVDEAVNERKSFDIDQEIITAKGKALWLRVRGNPQFKDSECIRISGTIQDIQELKLQSMLLKDSEEKYKSIIANSLTAHFLIHPDGRILEANKTALDMFGYTIDEMRTLGRADLLDTSDPNLAAYVKRREETGSAEAELTGIRKNGERFPHEISSVSFTDSNGIRRTSVSMVDITERKRAEENLRLSEAEFRAAFEYSALGMSLMDIDGRWIRINESFCRILGYTNRELMSRSLYELAHADDRDK
ncbi:MAG TPA: PAS domain S-box protein, partial [Daejeonella sp.]